jgi:Holliday junction resolvase RusA-like endonuclease
VGGGGELISFTVFGSPVAQGRPKFARRGKNVVAYDPEKSLSYKQLVYVAALPYKPVCPLVCPLCVEITAYIQIPASWSKKKQEEARKGRQKPTGRPDCDNFAKGILDSLKGLMWKDDSQIVELTISKEYSDTPRAEVDIREVE